MTSTSRKFRIAPTPSGFLHAGNAANFLLTDRLAKAAGSKLLLRIDDIDNQRARPEYVAHIFKVLELLGIQPDEGPKSEVELVKKWSQHLRLDRYAEALQKLRDTGCLYACNCSRSQIRKASKNGLYPGTCRDKNLPFDAEGVAWRVRVPEDHQVTIPKRFSTTLSKYDLGREMGDFVIRKKDGLPAYQLVSLIDDLDYSISDIVRGEDLLSSSAAQLYLAELLDAKDFLEKINLYHHPLLKEANGEKLSKSAGALAIATGEKGMFDVGLLKQIVKDW